MSSPPLVLITGGNGFVGYAVLAGALKAGYHVRAAVRRQDAVDTISRGSSVQKYLSSGALTFVIVPDNTGPRAYCSAAESCSYIIHVASPLATAPGDLVTQAVAGNRAILEAAEATPTIKRIIFTSSTSSIRPFERMLPDHPANQAIASGRGDKVPPLTADISVPTQDKVSDDAPGFHRYINSKIAAANLVSIYSIDLKNFHFSIVNLMPGWILGPEELARRKQEAFKGSNLILGWLFMEISLAPLLGFRDGEEPPLLSETVHLDDVVEAHVNALDLVRVQGRYRNYLLCSDAPTGPVIMDAVDIVKRELPQEVAEGKIPFIGRLGTLESKFDTTNAERELLGHPFQPYTNQVRDTIKCIYKQIGPSERIALSKLAVEHLENSGRSLRIAIDISIWQFQIQSGQGGKNPALRTLYYRLLRLLALSIQPLFVFDGPHKPPFKRGKKIAPGAASLPDFLTKELLKRFGFPYHMAPGEAEAECALLQKEGIVDAVLSEDVDTMMFGCGMTLRNWTAEGTRGNKSPTHVNVYRAETTKGVSGLDSEGMMLVALMSGGDYIPAGVPGCGPKTACEAAKAGFGHDLCGIAKDDAVRLEVWRKRLEHELHTNESKYFRQKHKALRIPESFPDMTVLGYYRRPAVSSPEKVMSMRDGIVWSSEVNVPELRLFVADAFEWLCLGGAKTFIRGLAPALLSHHLIKRSSSRERNDETLEAKESAEARIVKAVIDRRSHWNTDGMPELRVAYIPNDIVPIDLDAEEKDDYQDPNASEEEQPMSGADDADGRSKSPTKKRGPSTYDPTEIEKIWVLETYVKLGVPLMVETWEEDMRDPKKFASRKARTKKAIAKAKAGVQTNTLDGFSKITKPGVTRALGKEIAIQPPESTQLAPSPRKKALAEQRRSKNQEKSLNDSDIQKPRVRSRSTAPRKAAPSAESITASPWALSKRPPDTLKFKSPTRYSALGIYSPGDPEYIDEQRDTHSVAQENQQCLASPPASPATPRKRRSRPTSPVSDIDPKPIAPHNKTTNTGDTADNPQLLSTPKTRDHAKPSPRKKQSPLERANDLFVAGQFRTPTSLRKENTLDRYIERESEPLTAKKVNRRLNFELDRTCDKNASPNSDASDLPSPSVLMSPRPSGKNAVRDASDDMQSPDMKIATQTGKKGKRLIALRESLEGAWKHLEPWDRGTRAARRVYSSVEVVDLTGA